MPYALVMLRHFVYVDADRGRLFVRGRLFAQIRHSRLVSGDIYDALGKGYLYSVCVKNVL